VFKDMPLPMHALARGAHLAARCAGAAGKYWEYHDRLFQAQPEFERGDLVRYAEEIGVDRAAFARCLEAGTHAAAVSEDVAQARALGIRSTPTFVINGRLLVGAHPIENFRAAVEEALAAR
jgi:protein-disulfide isomerase